MGGGTLLLLLNQRHSSPTPPSGSDLANNNYTVLSEAYSPGDTEIVVVDGSHIIYTPTLIQLRRVSDRSLWTIYRVTDVDGNTLTIEEEPVEGTARSYSANDYATCRVFAQMINQLN